LTQVYQIKDVLKNPKDPVKSIISLQEEITGLKKQVDKYEQLQLKGLSQSLIQKMIPINGVHFIGEEIESANVDTLKKLAFELKQHIDNPVVVLVSSIDSKANVVILIDESTSKERNLDASAIIKQKIAPLIKGGGGGQKTLATAGGQDSSALYQVIEAVKSLL
jgi:alanyl-tRNA synthetase